MTPDTPRVGFAPPDQRQTADAPAPEAKTLRDEFADTALKAMLTRHADFPLAMARNAYEYADAMMEARKK